MKRAIIIVLDSVGIGELPDAADFGDVGSNTLVNIKKARPETSLPHLTSLGLGNIPGKDIALLGKTEHPLGAYGKMAEKSIGKDTTTGHWEIAGIITEKPFPTFTENGFPEEITEDVEETETHQGETLQNKEPEYVCDECGAPIKENVYGYSVKRYGRPLCIKCQRGGGKR